MSEEEIIARIKNLIDYIEFKPDRKYNTHFAIIAYPEEQWFQAIQGLLKLYNKEKEKNKELSNSYDKLAKECNEENRRCMLLAVENQDLKEKNKRLEKFIENGEHTWKQKYNETFKYVENEFISKDKIRLKMNQEMDKGYRLSEERHLQNYAYDRLKELLEE